VRYSSGRPARSNQAPSNTFGLYGEGKLIIDGATLTFEGKRGGFTDGLRAAPKIPLAEVANVDYNAEKSALLLRTRGGKDYVVVWAASREDADAIWAMLPQEKTPEFLANEAAYDRFDKVMLEVGKRAFVTPALIGINVAMFIAMLAAGADLILPNPAIYIRFGSNYGPLTWTGQEWRLLTAAFLHFGVLHIALNMFALYQGGELVERLFGSTRFALIYLLSALSGSIVSGWHDPFRNSAGASGAIFGVYGALLAFTALRRADFPPSMLKGLSAGAALFTLYSLGIGWAHPLINNASHIGGLLAGFISGAILARPFAIEARALRQPARMIVAAVVVGLPLAVMAQSLFASDGTRAASLRFHRDVFEFHFIESELARRQADILTYRPDVRINRLETAKLLRDEVLIPWRKASRPILQSATIPVEDTTTARLQAAWRDYVTAREEAVALRVLALQTGSPSDEARAESADARMADALNRVNELMRE
jgi:rhomboid protease GluP